jgi:DNA-binding helix-hairpin-helix protein with protein kinase domain
MLGVSHALQSKGIRPDRGIFYTSQSDMVRLGRRIGTGAEGEVYEIRGRSDQVAKVYNATCGPDDFCVRAHSTVSTQFLLNNVKTNLPAALPESIP